MPVVFGLRHRPTNGQTRKTVEGEKKAAGGGKEVEGASACYIPMEAARSSLYSICRRDTFWGLCGRNFFEIVVGGLQDAFPEPFGILVHLAEHLPDFLQIRRSGGEV